MPDSIGEQFHQIESLVARIDEIADPQIRDNVQKLIASILELQGAGLDRMLDIVYDSGESGRAAIRRFAADNLISSLLILHDLHPDDLGTRVERALAKMSGNAELVGVFEGEVRVRLTGSHCGLKESVESTLREAVPDAAKIIVEETPAATVFVPVESISGFHALNAG